MTGAHGTPALRRLRDLLPLRERQRALPPVLAGLHRSILRHFAAAGRPMSLVEIGAALPGTAPKEALARLAELDLVVVEEATGRLLGAYPMTSEATPHAVQIHGHTVYAMCAVDALAVGAMFDAEVVITSRCHLSATPVELHQCGRVLSQARPETPLQVGIAWQAPGACAAHSLCREMVFLRDAATAAGWQRGAAARQCLSLDEGLRLGADFFIPLLEE